MANEFAKAFAVNGVKFINREEDCGDTGLRISKLQYQPIDIKEKNLVKVKTLFDRITSPVLIKTSRLTVEDISIFDKQDYKNLYLDDELNRLWGYDYREDLGDNVPDEDYFYSFQQSLKNKKEEYSFAVKLSGKMIGELVLHNFDYYGGVEMGFRFFKEYQGNGYATESAEALKWYVFEVLKAKTLYSRCFKENTPSHNLILRLGLAEYKSDKTHYYFSSEH
jgi:RimJ/RimL family protein N-acetyltransferase